MDSLNAFESVFRRAIRDRYEFGEIKIKKVLLLTDLDPAQLQEFETGVLKFLANALKENTYELARLEGKDFANWSELKARVDAVGPDLIISYRLLRIRDRIDTSLGVYIDALSQATDYPILIMPNPRFFGSFVPEDPERITVLVATEHLYADNRLVNYAVGITEPGGKLLLAHIEDEDTFGYYMKAIGRIPEIDTDAAREQLKEQLTVVPLHYIESVQEVLATQRPDLETEMNVGIGHLISSYSEMVKTHKVDILVVQTKDDTQMAAHSLGYSLAIEFKEMPVLLI